MIASANNQISECVVAGVMTGNSVDAIDVASFRMVVANGCVSHIEQIGFHSSPCTKELRDFIFALKDRLKESHGHLRVEMKELFESTTRIFHLAVNQALEVARAKLRNDKGIEIDLIGFHGQTLGHAPPRVVIAPHKPYTIQLGDGGLIADVQGVVTVSDFRSDDLLNGGEGAPLAPGFNAHLASMLGFKRAVFINAGNTSNIGLIDSATGDIRGWDCGPCNQFSDLLMREERGLALDLNGSLAEKGLVRDSLIRSLWDSAVLREDGSNALELQGARSFDPQWYNLPLELRSLAEPLEDRIRSVVAFAAYCIAHSIARAIEEGFRPEVILLCGGGWKNPVLVHELRSFCTGRATYILPEHRQLFASMRLIESQADSLIQMSDQIGLPNDGMEAGIFAFAAMQRVLGIAFTQPSITGCKSPTRCGAVHIPQSGARSVNLSAFKIDDERGLFRDSRLGRAAPVNQ